MHAQYWQFPSFESLGYWLFQVWSTFRSVGRNTRSVPTIARLSLDTFGGAPILFSPSLIGLGHIQRLGGDCSSGIYVESPSQRYPDEAYRVEYVTLRPSAFGQLIFLGVHIQDGGSSELFAEKG